jgi:hypothetical protein
MASPREAVQETILVGARPEKNVDKLVGPAAFEPATTRTKPRHAYSELPIMWALLV